MINLDSIKLCFEKLDRNRLFHPFPWLKYDFEFAPINQIVTRLTSWIIFSSSTLQSWKWWHPGPMALVLVVIFIIIISQVFAPTPTLHVHTQLFFSPAWPNVCLTRARMLPTDHWLPFPHGWKTNRYFYVISSSTRCFGGLLNWTMEIPTKAHLWFTTWSLKDEK